MTIQSVIAFYLIDFLLYLCHGDAGKLCPHTACSEGGPSISYPFWLKDQQPESCGYQGYELSCSESETVIEFPNSGQFFVVNIDYESQNISIGDPQPQGCLARRLITSNFTTSPFTTHDSDRYTLLNCSSSVETQDQIDCLSSSNYHVYAVHVDASAYLSSEMNLDFLSSNCHFVANISPLYDSFTHLSWDFPGCNFSCRESGGKCRLKYDNSSEVECSADIPQNKEESLAQNIKEKPLDHNTKKKLLGHRIKKVSIVICIGILTSALMVTIIILYMISRKTEAKENRKKIKKFLEDCKSLNPTRYSYADVRKMTNNFKKQLGQGGYGSVFKGELENRVPVAVKVLDNSKGNGEDFTNEVSTIGRIHHVNVVQLLGYYADGSDRALVYEFMPNKSLDKFIFPANSKRPKLSWAKLQDIAIGVARGIEYLHQGCDQRILHFDIKPQNILLDADFNPKISDFGLAKLFPKKESVVPITAVRGTMGYIAPEVYFSGNTGNVSYETDVYSFGMLLFEMVGGRKNKDLTVENISQVYFPQWVYKRLADGQDLGIKEEKNGDAEIAKKLSILAIWCVQWDPNDRPSISTVIQMLEGGSGSFPLPPDPFASLGWEESDTNVP